MEACDEFISSLEVHLSEVKRVREEFHKLSMSQNVYEESMCNYVQKMQNCLDGIRHTYTQLVIPEYLQIPKSAPLWPQLSEQENARFLQISSDNDFQQREIISKFKKPMNRMVSIENVAKKLAEKQEAVRDDNIWLQADLMTFSFTSKLRLYISYPDHVDGMLEWSIKAFADDTGQIIPYDEESALLFLITAFGDDKSPLRFGVKCKDISEEIGRIALYLNRLASGVSFSTWVGHLRPFVADLHRDVLVKEMNSKMSVIVDHLTEAIEIIEDVSMADFGSDGSADVLVTERVKSCSKFEGVERLAAKMQEAGETAVAAVGGRKVEAAKMLAVVMIAESATWLPAHYAYATGWCSDSMYERFTMKTLFMMAFDLIVNVIPSFE